MESQIGNATGFFVHAIQQLKKRELAFSGVAIWCFHGLVEIVIGQIIQGDVPCLPIEEPVHLSREN